MKCLVCDNEIRINTLKQLFSPAPLLVCGRCEQQLIPKQGDVLFEDNDWLRAVIDQLNQGDVALIDLFKNHLKRTLRKRKAAMSTIKIVEYSDELPYPWLKILVDKALVPSSRQHDPAAESLVVGVVSQKNVSNQLSILP